MLAWCNLSAALNANKLTYSFSVHRSAWLPLVATAATLASGGDFDDFQKWLVTNTRSRAAAVSRSQREWRPQELQARTIGKAFCVFIRTSELAMEAPNCAKCLHCTRWAADALLALRKQELNSLARCHDQRGRDGL